MMGYADLVGNEVAIWYTKNIGKDHLCAAGQVRIVTFNRDGEPILWLQIGTKHREMMPSNSIVNINHIYPWPIHIGCFRIEVLT